MGAGEEQLFESLEVVELFQKNAKFTEGLQLEPGLSRIGREMPAAPGVGAADLSA